MAPLLKSTPKQQEGQECTEKWKHMSEVLKENVYNTTANWCESLKQDCMDWNISLDTIGDTLYMYNELKKTINVARWEKNWWTLKIDLVNNTVPCLSIKNRNSFESPELIFTIMWSWKLKPINTKDWSWVITINDSVIRIKIERNIITLFEKWNKQSSYSIIIQSEDNWNNENTHYYTKNK